MKNNIIAISSLAVIVGLSIGLSSCKDDEKPTKAKVTFAKSTMAVIESVGTIEVSVVLDRAVSKDISIDYSLTGTALDLATSSPSTSDYTVVGDNGSVDIAKGETKGTIQLQITADSKFEANETIIITLDDTNTSDVEIGDEDEIEITVTNDDEAPVASFSETTLTVNEDDGLEDLLEIEVKLDAAAPTDVTVKYEFVYDDNQDMAIDSVTGYNEEIPTEYYDYFVEGVSGEVVVAAGESTAKIQIQLLTDFHFDPDEKIIIHLIEGTSGVQIGDDDTMTITVKQQNGKVIALLWDDNVDMDLVLWTGPRVDSLVYPIATSAIPSTTNNEEILFIPAIFTNGAYGLTFNYYSGAVTPLNFEVQYADFVDGALEPLANRNVYDATYTTANITAWETTADLQIEQTFKVVAGTYTEISGITIPSAGSRVKSNKGSSAKLKYKSSKSIPSVNLHL